MFGSAGVDSYRFARLGGKVKASDFEFQVLEKNDHFYLQAQYKIGSHNISASLDEPFLNEWAASREGQKRKENPVVYVDPNDLSYSALQKSFPTKEWAYTLVLVILSGYFFMLDRKVKGERSTNKRRS
jgi:hypothetical protein